MPLTHNNYTAHISINGEELSQSYVEVEGNVARCNIQGRAGRLFKVHVDDPGEHDKCIRVYVDGQYLAGVAARAGVSACLESVRTSAHATRGFLFASQQPGSCAAGRSSGMIEVRIVHAERTNKAPAPRIINTCIPTLPDMTSPVVLSEESLSAVQATQSYRPTQSWDDPLIAFQFFCMPEDPGPEDGDNKDSSSNDIEFDELDSDEEFLDISWASTPCSSSPGSSQCPVDLTDSPATSPSPCATESSFCQRTTSPIGLDALSDTGEPHALQKRALIPGPSQRSSSQKRLSRYLESSEDENIAPQRRVKPRIEVNLKPYVDIETTRSARAKYNNREYARTFRRSSKKRRGKSPVGST
ncbi:unnamed protein product [Peniophora sp. CBMAI 1063]|nr:unnamed protein product [Peniophora sp. CBMAI 1063]